MRRCLTRRDENGAGETRRDFAKGQTRARHGLRRTHGSEFSREGDFVVSQRMRRCLTRWDENGAGETRRDFAKGQRRAADTRLGIFERGKQFREERGDAVTGRC
ncbi:hypothetical protein SBA3_3630013 [Candidatus Sulfopaludibacter sp. SbA3]|nr:hypothetical protein SBA3_3630013 [Candidatus Sulfopaludibacter sp. SbA3]